MELTKTGNNFDPKKVEDIRLTEHNFIINIFTKLRLPNRIDATEAELNNGTDEKTSTFKKTPRATSLSELQERLEAITSKKKITYKGKSIKKELKNRMKIKTKRDQRNAEQKLLKAEKASKDEIKSENSDETIKPAKPVFNSEGNMVFSKFDFSNLGKPKKKKQEKDPKKILQNLEKQKEQLVDLQERGEVEKAIEIKEKFAWQNALARADGKKVKDDPTLLKKTVKKLEQKKRASKRKWEAREEGVKKAKEARQQKRTDNIKKRKTDKKKNKLKKAAKRGKIIPGY